MRLHNLSLHRKYGSPVSNVLGIPVDNLDYNEVIRRIANLVSDAREDGRSRYVATVNVDFIVNAVPMLRMTQLHRDLLHVLRGADLVTADGVPVVWLSKLTGQNIQHRVTGADLLPKVAALCSQQDFRMFILGADDATAYKAKKQLQEQHPGLDIAGMLSPRIAINGEGMSHALEADVCLVEQINASGADILVIALGNPKQEIWYERNRHLLRIPVCIGVGGTLNFITGKVRRAPSWMHGAGLEWVYRLLQEPGRLWKRYAIGLCKYSLLALPLLIVSLVNMRRRASGSDQGRYSVLTDGHRNKMQRLILPPVLNHSDVADISSLLDQGHLTHTVFDFSNVYHVELDVMADLVRLWASLRDTGINWLACGMRRRICRNLHFARASVGFEQHICDDFPSALKLFGAKANTIRHWTEDGVVYLVGSLTNLWIQTDPLQLESLSTSQRRLTVNLDAVDSIDNAGMAYLLQERVAGNLILSGADHLRIRDVPAVNKDSTDTRFHRPTVLPGIPTHHQTTAKAA